MLSAVRWESEIDDCYFDAVSEDFEAVFRGGSILGDTVVLFGFMASGFV